MNPEPIYIALWVMGTWGTAVLILREADEEDAVIMIPVVALCATIWPLILFFFSLYLWGIKKR